MNFNVSTPEMAAICAGVMTVPAILKLVVDRHNVPSSNCPPAVAGRLPLIGNLHQLKDKKPHSTFSSWSELYGPIYTIKMGASDVVVLNSNDLAKEAMVRRFSSINTRKLPRALSVLCCNKAMVAMSDHDDFHKEARVHIINSLLGPAAQKRRRREREEMVENLSNRFHSMTKDEPLRAVNFRQVFKRELLLLSMRMALGKDTESVYVKEIGKVVSLDEMFDIIVADPLEGAVEGDWRDFFPYLSWIPNVNFESKIQQIQFRKTSLTKALIDQQRKRISSGEIMDCYLDSFLSEDYSFTEEQVSSLVWEALIEAADTVFITNEWAMFELARNQKCQERLYHEIEQVCGSKKMTEDDISKLPYLTAVFHETLRLHSPVPILPFRYAHEDTQLGGYHIHGGSQIAVNIYGCNMDKSTWNNPQEWIPERFLDEEKYEAKDLYKTMAFGGGKRVCAGSLQAMLVSCSTIGRLVQEFHWQLKEGESGEEDTVHLTTHKLHPFQAYVKPRK